MEFIAHYWWIWVITFVVAFAYIVLMARKAIVGGGSFFSGIKKALMGYIVAIPSLILFGLSMLLKIIDYIKS